MMNDIRLWSRRSVSRLLRRMKVSNVHELPVACKRRVTWDVANLTANTAATTLPSSPLPSVIATSTSIHVAGGQWLLSMESRWRRRDWRVILE
nr:hypothetical protein Iba_scaffold706878CG0010 [Ipomoea batatas]GME08445.1 hypothetical protein Iba_scaffold7622CG0040 [Ipomoea batatas]